MFSKPVDEVVATVADLFRHQGQTAVVELLERAFARFEQTGYDNWDGGTYTWSLILEVPTSAFAPLEKKITEIEKEIGEKLTIIFRQFSNDHLGGVAILPLSPGKDGQGQRTKPSDSQVKHLWTEGRFRLFLSHLDADKIQVTKLKDELSRLGVSSFVAHLDIKPSRTWQDQIKLGLRSMDALAAIITPQFHKSQWTDQEVGWALGREVPVINARLGKDPYGLAGEYQGVSGTLDAPGALAKQIVLALLEDSRSRATMRRCLVQTLRVSKDFLMSLDLGPIIIGVNDFTEVEKDELRLACEENDQVYRAGRVAEQIYQLIGRREKPPTEDSVPF